MDIMLNNIVNCTERDITLKFSEGSRYVVPPAGIHITIRDNRDIKEKVSVDLTRTITMGTIPIIEKTTADAVVGLPKPEKGKIYLVAPKVGRILDGSRNDVFVPCEPLVDENRKILGYKAIRRV